MAVCLRSFPFLRIQWFCKSGGISSNSNAYLRCLAHMFGYLYWTWYCWYLETIFLSAWDFIVALDLEVQDCTSLLRISRRRKYIQAPPDTGECIKMAKMSHSNMEYLGLYMDRTTLRYSCWLPPSWSRWQWCGTIGTGEEKGKGTVWPQVRSFLILLGIRGRWDGVCSTRCEKQVEANDSGNRLPWGGGWSRWCFGEGGGEVAWTATWIVGPDSCPGGSSYCCGCYRGML